VASASEPGMIVTNGMSEFARDKENANSALVVSVEPGDFGSSHPWPVLIFRESGKGWLLLRRFLQRAPVQRLGILSKEENPLFGNSQASYTGGTNLADIHSCLPTFVTDSIKKAIPYFDSKIKGFGMKDALLQEWRPGPRRP